MEAVNRKLIRPSLNEIKEQITPPRRQQSQQKKPVPPDQTNAENFYYVKQMQAKTPMVLASTAPATNSSSRCAMGAVA